MSTTLASMGSCLLPAKALGHRSGVAADRARCCVRIDNRQPRASFRKQDGRRRNSPLGNHGSPGKGAAPGRCATLRAEAADSQGAADGVSVELNSVSEDPRVGQRGFLFGKGEPGAWDSGGIGRAVVKRYGSGEECRWFMWYEGWLEERGGASSSESTAGVPQRSTVQGITEARGGGSSTASTGSTQGAPPESVAGDERKDKGEEAGFPAPSCTGLALSSNGLIWTRGTDTVITDSRGQGGAGLVLQPSNNWWNFDTRHVGVSDVIIMASHKVRASSGLYWMFYEGSSAEDVSLPASLPQFVQALSADNPEASGSGSSGPSATLDAKMFAVGVPRGGLRSRPGLAMSHDGRNWAAIEGDHHSGALFDVGEDGEWDSFFVGAPQVVYHRAGDVRMYYHSLDPSTGRYSIGFARSRDGLKWTKFGRIFDGSRAHAFDRKGALRPYVVPDPRFDGGRTSSTPEKKGADPSDSQKYVMLYEGVDEQGRSSICLAESVDGMSGWQSVGALLRASEEESGWDSAGVGSPCLVQMEDSFRLYYVGRNQEGEQGIGAAECSVLGTVFERIPGVSISI